MSSKAGSKGGTLCANPLLPVAAAACCEKAEDDKSAYSSVTYDGERMTFASAVSRCDRDSIEACNFDKIAEKSHKLSSFYLTLDECSIKIKLTQRVTHLLCTSQTHILRKFFTSVTRIRIG